MRMTRIRSDDAQARLARALATSARAGGCELRIDAARSQPWASATFAGEQQGVTIRLEPANRGREWLAALPDADLPMAGHVAMPPTVESVEEHGGALFAHLAVLTLVDG